MLLKIIKIHLKKKIINYFTTNFTNIFIKEIRIKEYEKVIEQLSSQ